MFLHSCDLAPLDYCFYFEQVNQRLLHVLHSCAMCVSFSTSRAEISSLLSASLGGERQRVWNFRGVCHCRDVAQGSDRMISLYISRALLSLSNVVPMVHLSVEISTSVLSLYPYNMVPTMVYRVAFLYEIYRQRQKQGT